LPRGYFEDNGEEYLVGLVDPIFIRSNIGEKGSGNINAKFPDKKMKLLELAGRIQDSDNPVLVLVRLKKPINVN